MENFKPQEITLSSPIKAYGKVFIGDYGKAPQYIGEVQAALNKTSTRFIPNKVMGVYYDSPEQKKTEDLKSFHGVFVRDNGLAAEITLDAVEFSGKCLYVKVSGDPMRSIYEGYNALFDYIKRNSVHLESTTGYQISTFESGVVITEIYMKII
jgi:effector-binding domain-containing protein